PGDAAGLSLWLEPEAKGGGPSIGDCLGALSWWGGLNCDPGCADAVAVIERDAARRGVRLPECRAVEAETTLWGPIACLVRDGRCGVQHAQLIGGGAQREQHQQTAE